MQGDLETVKILTAAGANVDHQDKDGYTALMLASASGYAKDLIKAGDNTKSAAELWFMSITIKCHLEVVKTYNYRCWSKSKLEKQRWQDGFDVG